MHKPATTQHTTTHQYCKTTTDNQATQPLYHTIISTLTVALFASFNIPTSYPFAFTMAYTMDFGEWKEGWHNDDEETAWTDQEWWNAQWPPQTDEHVQMV